MKNHRNAFTRVELLVVVFLVILSISALVPVLAAARKHLSSIEICAWKQRKILQAIDDYAGENDGWYPVRSPGTGPYWHYVLKVAESIEGVLLSGGFLDSAASLQCPSDDADFRPLEIPITNDLTGEVIPERTQENYRTYGFNLNHYGWANRMAGWRKQTEVRIPQRTVLISETPSPYNILYQNAYSCYFGPLPPNKDTTYGLVSGYSHWPGYDIYAASDRHYSAANEYELFIHKQGCNYGFADGHAEYVEVDIEEEYPPFWWFDNGLYKNMFWSPQDLIP